MFHTQTKQNEDGLNAIKIERVFNEWNEKMSSLFEQNSGRQAEGPPRNRPSNEDDEDGVYGHHRLSRYDRKNDGCSEELIEPNQTRNEL